MSAAGGPRVVLATRIYPPDLAAAAFRLEALVGALQARGARVIVLTTGPGMAGVSEPATTSANVRRWPVLRDRSGYVRGYLPYLSFDLPLALRVLLVPRPDIVVVEPPPTTAAVLRVVLAARDRWRRRRIPYVYYAADVWSDASAATAAPRPVVRALRAVERFALRGAAEAVAVSEGVAERVRALGARSATVVPNGVDTGVFSPQGHDGERQRHGMPDGPFLLYAGTASEWQGAEIFAEAMPAVLRHHPAARLVFLGQGSAWPRLRRLATHLPPGAVDLRPLVEPSVAAAWHRAAAAALASVRPGLDYDFAYPTKVLAALACGTPAVYAGPGPAAADLIEHRLGTAVPYEVNAVADAMVAALKAAPDAEAAERRVKWVAACRSLEAGARQAARVVLEAARPAR